MLLKLSGRLTSSSNSGVEFKFERGLLQQLIDKQKALLRRNASLWWNNAPATTEEEQNYRASKRIRKDNHPNIYPPTVTISLVDLQLCDVKTHHHLGSGPAMESYPTTEVYVPTILVDRSVLTGETSSLAPDNSSPSNRFKRSAEQHQQQVDSIRKIRKNLKPATIALNNSVQQIAFKAYFGTFSGLGVIERNDLSSYKSAVEKFTTLCDRELNAPFGNWFEHSLNAEIKFFQQDGVTPVTNLSQAKKAKLQLTLPPKTKLCVNNTLFWQKLGFAQKNELTFVNAYEVFDDNLVDEIQLEKAGGFRNDHETDKLIVLSPNTFTLDDDFFAQADVEPSQRFLFKFTRKKTGLSKLMTLTPGTALADRYTIAPQLFRSIFSNIHTSLGLIPHILDTTTGPLPPNEWNNRVDLIINTNKKNLLQPNAGAEFPLTLEFHISAELMKILKIAIPSDPNSARTDGSLAFAWQPDKQNSIRIDINGTTTGVAPQNFRSLILAALRTATSEAFTETDSDRFSRETANLEEDPVKQAELQKQKAADEERKQAIDDLKSDLLDNSVFSRFKTLKDRITELDKKEKEYREKYESRFPSISTTLNEIKNKIEVLTAKATRDKLNFTSLNAISEQIDNIPSEKPVSGEDPLETLKLKKIEEINKTNMMLDNLETEIATTEQESKNSIELELLKETNKLLQQQAASLTSSLTTSSSSSSTSQAELEKIVETVTKSVPNQVAIPNPVPPRGDKFVLFQSNEITQEICSLDHQNIPDQYMLVVDEGEPKDFIVGLGYRCILGAIKSSSSKATKINNNNAIICNAHNLDRLHVRFLTYGLGEYKPAAEKPLFVSMLIRVSPTMEPNPLFPR